MGPSAESQLERRSKLGPQTGSRSFGNREGRRRPFVSLAQMWMPLDGHSESGSKAGGDLVLRRVQPSLPRCCAVDRR